MFERGEAGPLKVLATLDAELDKVGIHTAADAKLLRELGVSKGRAGRLAAGLAERAAAALDEVESQVRWLERRILSGENAPGELTRLLQAFIKLARAVKVADLFADVGVPQSERFVIFERAPAGSAPPSNAKVAIARYWAERAKTQLEDVVQKRRDLDAAHELLLRTGTDSDREEVRRLRIEVAAARERVRAAPSVRSLHDLVRHVRHVARRDPGTAYRSLKALYERALEANDREVAEVARRSVGALLPKGEALHKTLSRWQRERVRGDELTQLAFALDDEKLATFELAAGCARYFDVEDALAEEIVEAEVRAIRPVARRVPFPTQTMTFEFTHSLDELPNFVISDPRSLVYDLASNRQVLRAYLDEEPPPITKRVRKTAVRVYVCDASGSMHGPRARFRDAIVIAELNNLRLKAATGQPFDPLYFSFFNDTPTELARVDTAEEAARQIEKLFSHSPAEGQTDITLALMAAFESIRSARGTDPYLAKATVVLVTDGEDAVDLEVIRRTRAPMEGLEIALSFISLGEENPDLKALAAEQRQRGGRAFYHHLTDREISSARTEFDSGWRTLLPQDVPATAEALELLLPHLEALEAIAFDRPPPTPARTADSFDALFPEKAEGGRLGATSLVPRVIDILEAIGEAVSLAPADQRGTESALLLQHLLGVYGIALPRYLELTSSPEPRVREKVDRIRLLCRPFG